MNKITKLFALVALPLALILNGCKKNDVVTKRGSIDVELASELPFPLAYKFFKEENDSDKININYEFVKDNRVNGDHTDLLILSKEYPYNDTHNVSLENKITNVTRMFTFSDINQDGNVDHLIRYISYNSYLGDLKTKSDTLNLNLPRTTFIENREDISKKYKNLISRIE